MKNDLPAERIRTRIWLEEAEADSAYTTRAAFCHGYDVFGDMLGRARWVDMLYLLFKGAAPNAQQAQLLETLAVMLANAGPRDPAVHAAMCAGVGGSPAAAALMAALAVGAGQHTGARELYMAMQCWTECGLDLTAWQKRLVSPPPQKAEIWPGCDYPPGFDINASSTPLPVLQALDRLAAIGVGRSLALLQSERCAFEAMAGHPLGLIGVAAAAFVDLNFSADEGEMLQLLLRLPGAAAHALEQRAYGHKNFPFFPLELCDEPAGEQA